MTSTCYAASWCREPGRIRGLAACFYPGDLQGCIEFLGTPLNERAVPERTVSLAEAFFGASAERVSSLSRSRVCLLHFLRRGAPALLVMYIR